MRDKYIFISKSLFSTATGYSLALVNVERDAYELKIPLKNKSYNKKK